MHFALAILLAVNLVLFVVASGTGSGGSDLGCRLRCAGKVGTQIII